VKKSNRIVSSDAEQLILVDEQDRATGFLSKAECHNGSGVLHRAFSIFLFDAHGELLIQQRSANKRLWPGYWSNTCCSHPRRGESMQEATGRRLRQELQIETAIEFAYKFSYHATFEGIGAEHELCHVYLGRHDGPVSANKNEIAALRYVKAAALAQELQDMPQQFTPWLKMEWQSLTRDHGSLLAKYCDWPSA